MERKEDVIWCFVLCHPPHFGSCGAHLNIRRVMLTHSATRIFQIQHFSAELWHMFNRSYQNSMSVDVSDMERNFYGDSNFFSGNMVGWKWLINWPPAMMYAVWVQEMHEEWGCLTLGRLLCFLEIGAASRQQFCGMHYIRRIHRESRMQSYQYISRQPWNGPNEWFQ